MLVGSLPLFFNPSEVFITKVTVWYYRSHNNTNDFQAAKKIMCGYLYLVHTFLLHVDTI